MKPLSPPDQPRPDHSTDRPAQDTRSMTLDLADLDTQPVPAASDRFAPAGPPPSGGRASRSWRRAGSASVADRDTQPLPGVRAALPNRLSCGAAKEQASDPPPQAPTSRRRYQEARSLVAPASSPAGAGLGSGVGTSAPASRKTVRSSGRRAPRRRDQLQVPPWLMRLALVLGLVVLGVRAGSASLALMTPGGYIVDWSRLPPARCILCHAPQPTVNPSHPLTPAQYAALLLPQLSLDDELGQMMIVQFIGLEPTPDAIQMIASQGAGGVLFFSSNIKSADQLRSMNQQLQRLAPLPLLLTLDQEGGPVNRLMNVVGPLPSASSLRTPAQAEARGAQDAGFLSDFGFNLDLAPVVDVGTANPQLAGRTFGTTPDRVETMAGAYLTGLQQSGAVTGTLKHYPGLGDTSTDPHIGLPILYRSRADWERIDLDPYRVLLKTQDVRAIMVTHELVPAVDKQYPASLSPALIDGVLRGELGYNGVVITDSLYMGALNQRWSVPEAAVLAIKAGADIVIGPYNPEMAQQTMDALKQALSDGTLTRARIDTSVLRILTLKIEMGLIPLPHQSSGTPLPTPSGTPQADALQFARLPDAA